MARVKKHSRHAALLAAFMCVMSATGGLFGAVGGVILALLTHTLLGPEANTIYLMAVSVLVGVVVAILLSVAMVTPRRVARQPRVETQAQVESL